MTWWPAAVAAALALDAIVQAPTFRARVEAVRLDVLVTRDNVPVRGLTAGDFEVRDNGVLQRATAATAIESVQLGIVLDASGSMTGDRIEVVRGATAELLGQLRPADTVAVVAFGDQVGSLLRRSHPEASPVDALQRLRAAGGTALIDGIYAGLIETGSGPGPKLLLAMTDGRNNNSALAGAHVIDVARRLEIAIYPVAVGVDRQWVGTRQKFRTSDALALLQVLAEETGGRAIEAEWNTRLAGVFRGVLEEFRQRYVVTFTPDGVGSGDGWHTLDVRVKRRGLTVRSRTRYWSG